MAAGASRAGETFKNTQNRSWRNGLRMTAIILLAGVGCAAVIVYSLAHWAERQVLTTSNWVATVAPIPREPVVATALSGYITTQIFSNVPVQDEIENALPPKASFLSSPLTTQLQDVVTRVTKRIIMGDGFQNVWAAANRIAMDRLVGEARGQTQPLDARLEQAFTIDLSGVRGTLQSELGTSASALPELSQKASKPIEVTADLKAKRERVWELIRSIDFLSAVLPLVAVASTLAALALSYDRRKALLAMAMATVVLFLIELIILKTLRQSVLDQVRLAGNQPAVGLIYDALTVSLRKLVYVWLAVAIVVAVGCLLAGPARWVVALRVQLRIGHLRGTMLGAWWRGLRGRVKQYRYYIWAGIGVLLLAWLAFAADISPRLLVNSVLAAVSLIAVIYIVAYPRGSPID